METPKVDRRVKYTRMVIRQSFVKLLRQKPISKITVKEICEDADVNRATFYAHYTDPYDLLHQIENDIVDDVNRYLDRYNLRSMTQVPEEMLAKILEYIHDNAELFDLLLLHSNGDIQFQQEITRIIGQRHFALQESPDEDTEYMYLFFANGTIGVILRWLRDGMKKPVGEMTELTQKLTGNSRSLLGK